MSELLSEFFSEFFSEMIPEVHFWGVGHGTLQWIRYYGADTLLLQCDIPNQPPPCITYPTVIWIRYFAYIR